MEGGLAGKIAFAERGLIRFEEKVTRAAAAGARGVVIYNNLPGNFRGVLRNQGSVPVVAISQRDGQMIKELLLAGPVRGSVSVGAEVHTSRNVVAEKLGQGDDVLVLGGHYDTVPDVPGANDNASGVAVLLTIAEELSQVSLPFTVRFIAFGSEELGLKGSLHYVASLDGAQRSRIRAMFNFDGVGSGRQLGILGDTGLTQFAVDLGAGENIDVRISAGLSRRRQRPHEFFQGRYSNNHVFLRRLFPPPYSAGTPWSSWRQAFWATLRAWRLRFLNLKTFC